MMECSHGVGMDRFCASCKDDAEVAEFGTWYLPEDRPSAWERWSRWEAALVAVLAVVMIFLLHHYLPK